MTNRTVINFPAARSGAPAYTDTAAMNDIHAILCSRGTSDPDVLNDIALVLARAGRQVVQIRDIQAAVVENDAGLPEAHIDAGATKVLVVQRDTGEFVVAIAAATPDAAQLTVTLNGHQLHPALAGQPGCP